MSATSVEPGEPRGLLHERLLEAAKRYATMPMIYASSGGVRQRTLGDVIEEGTRAAAGLVRLGLRQGDAVVAQVPNWPEGGALLYASLLLGLRIVPVIHIYGSAELTEIVRQTGAKAYAAPAQWRRIDFAERSAAVGRCETIEHVISIGGEADFADVAWDRLISGNGPEPRAAAQEPRDVCLVSFTSGTTSRPKGAQHTHHSLLSEVTLRLAGAADRREMAYLGAQPAGHIAGLLGFLRPALAGARRSAFLDAWDAGLALELIERYHLTATTGPPFYLSTLIREAGRAGYRLQIGDWVSGGERVPADLIEEADAAGIAAFRCYGSTEHPTVSTSLPTDPLQRRAHTDGILLPGVRIRIVDDDGREVGAGEEGEILTWGPDLFAGYLDRAHTAAAFASDGFYKTGDVGRLSAEGALVITDRKKDIVIRGGENISSREVEDILLRHPDVRDAAVVAVPDRLYGERVCAFLILESGADLSLEGVRGHFERAGVAKQKTPERLEIVDEFPRTLVGKIRKGELRVRAAALASGGAAVKDPA